MSDGGDELIRIEDSPPAFELPEPPHVSTIWRWALRGVGHPRVRLETIKIGGRRYVSRAAITRFIAATSRAGLGQPTASASRLAAAGRAAAELDADGIA